MSRNWIAAVLLVGCAEEPEPALTYYRDVSPVLDASCVGCHQEGHIAPFPLTTYAEVVPMAAAISASVSSGSMPPWQGDDDCNTYSNDFSLSEEDKALLIDWIDDGMPEGDPADAVELEAVEPFPVDLSLSLPEPYTPIESPDDYRCQLIEWPLDETAWITGMRIEPDQQDLVHHTIVFAVGADQAEEFWAMDAAEEGPGYSCFGGPRASSAESPLEGLSTEELLEMISNAGEGDITLSGQRWLGAWVPGVDTSPLPEGTGLRMEPGDLLIVQMHYNSTSVDPAADQSAVSFQLADEVDREAMVMPFTDLGWITGLEVLGGAVTIPAYNTPVTHETTTTGTGLFPTAARATLGLEADAPLVIHQVGHHMHQLGKIGYQEINHSDGSSTCLVHIPKWDFDWQGAFTLEEPVTLMPDDELSLTCVWDNSEANQPVVNGVPQEPQDVAWGEGTTDEMCLSTLYITGE